MINARLLYGERDIRQAVAHMGRGVAANTPKVDVLVPIMQGSCLFGPDLFREIARHQHQLRYHPLAFKRDAFGVVHAVDNHIYPKFEGKTVLIADTICDSGNTVREAIKVARVFMKARTVLVAFLFVRRLDLMPKEHDGGLYGFELDTPDYLFGYGLDRNNELRGLSSVWAESPSPTVPESLLGKQDKP